MSKMTPYRRAVAVTGTYTDRQGNEKKRYVNVGTLFQYDDGGLTLKLESLPVSGWNGFLNFYEIEDRKPQDDVNPRRDEGRTYASRDTGPTSDLDDSIPF
jgi:hypothetical protein